MTTNTGGTPRRDEELLAWLLDHDTRRRTTRAELEAEGAEVAERLDEWSSFLQSCRAELAEDASAESAQAGGLTDRILARTTREDVSWRGDWRLVRGFLGQRLGASIVLRVVAASLLVHIAALPVLAYYTWIAPEPETFIQFDRPLGAVDLPFGDAEPEPLPVVDEIELPALPSDDPAALPTAGALYRDRLAAAADGGSDPLSRALLAEALLDEAEAGGGDRERLGAALERLESEVRGAALDDHRPALRALLASAWLRASANDAVRTDEILTASCRRWLGQPQALTGARWYAGYLRAADEGDGR